MTVVIGGGCGKTRYPAKETARQAILVCWPTAKGRSDPEDELLRFAAIGKLSTYRHPFGLQASLAGSWVPGYDILLFFLRVGLTKIWELGTDPIAIRGSAVLEGPV
jgi:hypothetical protein